MSCKCVRPLMSISYQEAHTRMIGLYRAYYRLIPYIVKYYDVNKDEAQIRMKLRERFYRNACIIDIRVIDLLVIKGYMELKEIRNIWQQKGHIMAHWNPTAEPKPYDFIGKFLAGMD